MKKKYDELSGAIQHADEMLFKKNMQINELKKENERLKERICDLEKANENKKMKSLFNKYIMAFQDVNREKKICDNLCGKYKKYMNSVRLLRNKHCHYIDDDYDTKEIRQRKCEILFMKLKDMPEIVKKEFNVVTEKYFVENVVEKYFDEKQQVTDIPDDDLDYINGGTHKNI